MPAAIDVAPGSQVPASKPQGSYSLQTWVGYLAILSARNLDFATTHLSEPQAPCFAILLVLGSFPSTEH
jgi:hypothetical protein